MARPRTNFTYNPQYPSIYNPPGHNPEDHRSYARRDYVEQFPSGSVDRQLAILMSHVGLTGVDLSELGGNHPNAVMAERAKAKQQEDPQTGDPSKPLTDGPKEKNGKPKFAPYRGRASLQDPEFMKTRSKEEQRALLEDPEAMAADIKAFLKAFHAQKAIDPLSDKLADPIDLARKLETFMIARELTPTETAHELGYSRSHALNLLRLLTLPQSVQDQISEGLLKPTHGRAIAKMRDPEAMARLIISRTMSVRQAEVMARRLRFIKPDGTLTRDTAIPYTHVTERFIEDALGYKVRFKDRAGKGEIRIFYNSPKQAQGIVEKLTQAYFGLGPQDIGKDPGHDPDYEGADDDGAVWISDDDLDAFDIDLGNEEDWDLDDD